MTTLSTEAGLGIETKGNLFAVMYPDGSMSDVCFRSPYRAAEHAMGIANIIWWPTLAERGVRIVSVRTTG